MNSVLITTLSIATLSSLFIIYPVLKKKIIFQDKKEIGNRCRLKTIRSDTCFDNKLVKCPMSSYKQCTNNNYPVNKCNCLEKSYELCPKHFQFKEKCFMNQYNKMPDLTVTKVHPLNYPRVNMFRTQKTQYDNLTIR